MFLNSILSLEITKPSEQCIKTLFHPKQRGGVILLLTEPVGKQEYDNLDYLRRNKLIPSDSEHQRLYMYAEEKVEFSDPVRKALQKRAEKWRGLRLPDEEKLAVTFINWCLQNGLFAAMLECEKENARGVEKFWGTIDSLQ